MNNIACIVNVKNNIENPQTVIIHGDDETKTTAEDEYADYEEVVEDEAAEEDDTEHIIDKLTPIFYGNRENAVSFLVSIRNMKPIQICGKVRLLVRQKVISDISYQKDLWQILHDHKLYNLSRRNWNKHVM